jgi:hypothetical protein
MIPHGLLIADGEWIGIVIFVIFVVFSALSQLAAKWKEVQREVARRARANQPERFPKPADPLEDEIAEFLRRAAERQKPAQAERPAGQPPPLPSPPPRAADEAMRPSRPPILEPVAAEPAAQESVAEHVRDRFGRPQFGQVGSTGLGKEVAQTDEKVGDRLREKFGRQVSRLASVPGEAAAGPVAVEPAVPADRVAAPPAFDAAAVAALLTNPATLRQVILASEIFHRPEERWTH